MSTDFEATLVDLSNLQAHPEAERFPEMTDQELNALVEDIRARALIEPIDIYEGKIADGRNRYKALKRIAAEGGQPLVAGYFNDLELPPKMSLKAWVFSKNIHRRHLTTEQKRGLIAELLKDDPSQSNRKIAEIFSVSHHTVGAVREAAEQVGKLPTSETRTGRDGKSQPVKKTSKRKSARSSARGPQIKSSKNTVPSLNQNETKAVEKVHAAWVELGGDSQNEKAALDKIMQSAGEKARNYLVQAGWVQSKTSEPKELLAQLVGAKASQDYLEVLRDEIDSFLASQAEPEDEDEAEVEEDAEEAEADEAEEPKPEFA